jgi:hypothetical protein
MRELAALRAEEVERCATCYGARVKRAIPTHEARCRVRSTARAAIAAHPIITATIAGCALLGALLGALLLTDDWSLARRIAGGLVAGAGVGLLITAPRIVG